MLAQQSFGLFGDYAVIPLTQPHFPTGKPRILKAKASEPTTSRIFLPGDERPYMAGQCVNWVKYHTELQISGNAIAWAEHATMKEPMTGDVIVLAMGKWGHVGIVMSVRTDTLTYRSRNQDGLWVISDTTIPLDDTRILGYITP